MKSKRMMTLAAGMLLCGAAIVQAQDWKSYSYVEAQGGLQFNSDNASLSKLLTPTAALSLGHYFTPVVGARLHVNAWQSKCGFKDLDQYYKWKYVTPDLDLLVNLSNLFGSNKERALNVILLGGVGLNYSWDNDELKDLGVAPQRIPLAWDDNHLSHNLRAGLRLESNQSKPLGLSLELNANSLDDRFNSKTNDIDDWQFTAKPCADRQSTPCHCWRGWWQKYSCRHPRLVSDGGATQPLSSGNCGRQCWLVPAEESSPSAPVCSWC
jgi:hypothetical protein